MSPLKGGGWTFIDQQLRDPFEEISEHAVGRLKATYDEREWDYDVIRPNGTLEVSDS